MKTESIAATLLKGSRNIDFMRAEIESLAKLMIGLIWANQEELLHAIPEETRIQGSHGEWRLGKKINEQLTPVTRLVITYAITCGKSGNSLVYSSEASDCLSKPPMESVQSIYEDLSSLVDGIVNVLPKIKGFRWDALVRAADVTIA